MKKYWIYIAIGLVALLAVWYFFIRKSDTPSGGTGTVTVDLGFTKSGKPITESMLQNEMTITANYNRQMIEQKAKDSGKTYQEQLRADSLWMLQNADGH